MNRRCVIGLAIATVCVLVGNRAIAQVTADDTLPIPSRVLSSDAINFLVEGGTPSSNGENLFHSFETFSVPNNGQVTFDPGDASHIFSRVTGGELSRIRGSIHVNNDANLFLLNPDGIIFGPNASLDLNGSFLASSANRIIFDNGATFRTRDRSFSPDLLNITTPTGLQYGAQRNGPITINRSILDVAPGKSLTFLGGQVRINGPRLNTLSQRHTPWQLTAPQGVITLIGIRQGQLEFEDNLRIQDDRTGTQLINTNNRFANVEIRQNASLFTGNAKEPGNAGRVNIRGNNVIVDDSDINTQNNQSGNVGLITIQATRNLQLQNNTQMSTQAVERVVTQETIRGVWLIAPNGSVNISHSRVNTDVEDGGTASRIRIEAGEQIAIDNAFLTTTASGGARGGGIRLMTSDIWINRSRLIASNQADPGQEIVQVTVPGDDHQTTALAGRIVLTGFNSNDPALDTELETVAIRNSQLRTTANGRAYGNLIKINAPDGVLRIANGSRLSSRSSGRGDAGDIQIETGRFTLNDSQLISRTSARGDAGNILIEADQFILNGSQLASHTSAGGQAGRIGVMSENRLSLVDGSRLRSDTSGKGDAGNILIDVGQMTIRGFRTDPETGDLSSSGLFSQSRELISGDAGRIRITAERLDLARGGQISSSTAGGGEGGPIDIVAQTLMITGFGETRFSENRLGENGNTETDIPGSGIFSRVRNEAVSDNISIDEIAMDEEATGNGNAIHINAETVRLQNGGLISGSTFSAGDAGYIRIEAKTLDIEGVGQGTEDRVSGIYSRVQGSGTGNANDIDIIDAESVRLRRGGQISTSVNGGGTGQAGTIRIHSDRILIEASSAVPRDGDSTGKQRLIRSGIFSRILNDAASSEGGDIDITSDLILLNTQGRIQVNSRSQSEGGNGGNITINTESGFIAALPDTNSDLLASSTQGTGGNINITAQGIYGLVDRPQSRLTNDIDASSQFGVNGNIIILVPGTDPSRSVVALPNSLLTAEDRIDRTVCQVAATRNSRFIVVGQGGIHPAPREVLRSTDLWLDHRLPDLEEPINSAISDFNPAIHRSDLFAPDPLLEAQRWHIDKAGAVHLVVPSALDVPLDHWQLGPTC